MIGGKYLQLYQELEREIPKERLLHDSLNLLAYGVDASFYRLTPKLVVKVESEREMQHLIKSAESLSIPLTFRAAATSLSGQTISDSVMVVATHGWREYQILEKGAKIELGGGVIGAKANHYLKAFGRKIGPDPASIDSATVGGIVSNNASGMNSGVNENSYSTISDIRVILADGTLLDTSSIESCNSFRKSHSELINGLEELSKRVCDNRELKEKIVKKYSIKNTTGYGINSLVDYSDGIEILKHLLVGSEGTLAFISKVTLRTLEAESLYPYSALSLIIFPDMVTACNAAIELKKERVSAAEIMDRAALKSVEGLEGVPPYLKSISSKATALLVEITAESRELLEQKRERAVAALAPFEKELPIEFTSDSGEQAILWKIRKEILATIAGMRRSGTTPIIEDLCFPIENLANAANDIIALLKSYNYSDAAIWGHAKDGNLHFIFTQDFQSESEVKRYDKFIRELVELTINKYGGSLKAEHGTGRNMAPFVEFEWGSEAYSIMKEIKRLIDPKGILNPGVIINESATAHIENLKPIPSIRESVDSCMECGFCETICVSEGFTLSPRQRITVYREMERLRISGEESHRAAELQKLYNYWGLESCATDGLCSKKCPLLIDTGKLVKELREESHSAGGNRRALLLAKNMATVTASMRVGLNGLYYLRLLMGKRLFGGIATGLHHITKGTIPLWNQYFPKGAAKISNRTIESSQIVRGWGEEKRVVYFPSCINRAMGNSRGRASQPSLREVTETLLKRAGYSIIYPKELNSLCCGMAFSSKGYLEAGLAASNKLEEALFNASNGGEIPILSDMSPCLYTMQSNFGERLPLYEPAQFIEQFLLDALKIERVEKKISIFAVCSTKMMEREQLLYNIAKRCAKEVVVIESNCCGFAGDRGFLLPKLNSHGLRDLANQSRGSSEGYSSSRTCEIGLSNHSGIEFSSILYLVEEASRD